MAYSPQQNCRQLAVRKLRKPLEGFVFAFGVLKKNLGGEKRFDPFDFRIAFLVWLPTDRNNFFALRELRELCV